MGIPFTLTPDDLVLEKPVPVESVLVDGKGVGDVGRLVLKERRLLGSEAWLSWLWSLPGYGEVL